MGTQDTPRSSQDPPSIPKNSQGAPQNSQGTPKEPPRSTQELPRNAQERPRSTQELQGAPKSSQAGRSQFEIQLEPLVSGRNAQNGQSQETHKTDKAVTDAGTGWGRGHFTRLLQIQFLKSIQITGLFRKRKKHTKRTKPRNAQNGQHQEKHKTDKAKKRTQYKHKTKNAPH